MYDNLRELSDKTKNQTKFFEINFKKLLTKGFESDIVNKLSQDSAQMRTLITEQ